MIYFGQKLKYFLTKPFSPCRMSFIGWECPQPRNARIIMSEVKKVVNKQPSKKELINAIREKSGKTFKELDTLQRANRETIAWVLELIS